MANKHVLIIDDEPDICELIEITLTRMGFQTSSAYTIKNAYSLLKHKKFDLCLTDMHLPDGNGIELVEHIQKNYPDLPIAVITAHGNMELAIKALKAGAFDFVSKPVDIHMLRNLVSAATKSTTIAPNNTYKTQITGQSSAVKQLTKQIEKLAKSQAPVFIHGESGSGKERVARMIHEQGSRSDAAFVPVNCGAIPAELMESEFFGHIKGSFTGASSDKQGLFQAADGGTLFLDEIAELPMHMQVKLLRAVQEKAIRPVGAPHEIPVDVRILSASHKDLATQIKNGHFREDLYYRINVIDLSVPSLRKRIEDLPLLTEQILQSLANKSNLKSIPTLNKTALLELKSHSFPGNIRELENILERALAMAENNIITADDLNLKHLQTPVAEETTTTIDLASQEKNAIIQALEKTRWNKTAAAKQLGLSLRQLRYRLEKLGID
ncbi:MAG: sigma-54 dependent transcriptional regulator [Gammaproteobacteria bacterium]|nr:sigma-54 dependent transcriptional regulator [Gammaproteobacteria bacterium]MCW8922361.1 sigma-54 dependent transcriptional regulator [Gammaproteobacteria bacterium]